MNERGNKMRIHSNKNELSEYEFMRFLFATLVMQGHNRIIDDGLVKKLWLFKCTHPRYQELFYCFDFHRDLVSISSKGIETGILAGLTFGLIYTRVPSDGYIYFNFDKKYAKGILDEINDDNTEWCFNELAQYLCDECDKKKVED